MINKKTQIYHSEVSPLNNKLKENLRIPLIAAPMFRVSGPKLVIEACKSGIIGSFPTINPRTTEQLESWLDEINEGLRGQDAAPYAVNLVMSDPRFPEDLEVVKKYKPSIVITSVGSPKEAIEPIHSYGGLVYADVASLYHAKKAVELGVDGLILLCAGAGGNGGWANPFAFVREVRKFYDGTVILSGCVADGTSIRAAEVLGADLVYMGTKFIATEESLADMNYKQKVLESTMDDVVTTKAFTGLHTNFLRQTIIEAGFDPKNLPEHKEFNKNEYHRRKRWKEILSAGQGVGGVEKLLPVREVVDELYKEYKEA